MHGNNQEHSLDSTVCWRLDSRIYIGARFSLFLGLWKSILSIRDQFVLLKLFTKDRTKNLQNFQHSIWSSNGRSSRCVARWCVLQLKLCSRNLLTPLRTDAIKSNKTPFYVCYDPRAILALMRCTNIYLTFLVVRTLPCTVLHFQMTNLFLQSMCRSCAGPSIKRPRIWSNDKSTVHWTSFVS